MKPLQTILCLAWGTLKKDDKDMIFDVVEKLLTEKQQQNPTRSRALALGALATLRAIADIPDDDTDQLNPV